MALTIWPAAGDDSPALVTRAYGAGLSDLAVDFDRPLDMIISAILQSCLFDDDGTAFSGAEVAGWTLLKRRQGLLAVAAATNGPARKMTAACGTCTEKLDLDVDLTAFRQDWRVEDIPFGDARLRLPRPGDLADIEDGNEARLAVGLLAGEPPSGDWEAEAALSAADSLTDLEL